MLMFDLSEARYFLPSDAENEAVTIVVAGGRPPDRQWLAGLPDWPAVCADRGAEYALQAGLVPKLAVGDFDSAGPEMKGRLTELAVPVQQHPADKDFTDLQLLLRELVKKPVHLLVVAALGGRLDHLQSNLRSLLNYKQQTGKQVLLADGKESLALLSAGELCVADVKREKLPTVSVLALAAGSAATMDHVRWPMEKMPLNLAEPNTLSNRPLDREVWAQCDAGQIGFYLCYDERGL